MNERRLKSALGNWLQRAQNAQWESGRLGRTNADGTVTILVSERVGFVFVTMDKGVLATVRNMGRVPLRAGLPVDVRREADGVLTLDRQTPTGLMEDDANQPDAYAVPPHPLTSHADYAALLAYIQSLEARIEALEP